MFACVRTYMLICAALFAASVCSSRVEKISAVSLLAASLLGRFGPIRSDPIRSDPTRPDPTQCSEPHYSIPVHSFINCYGFAPPDIDASILHRQARSSRVTGRKVMQPAKIQPINHFAHCYTSTACSSPAQRSKMN